jgi:hypothetical protein
LFAFVAFTVPFGIGAHLFAELAGLGWHDDAEIAFSGRHLYLAVIAVATFVALLAMLRGIPRDGRRRTIGQLVAALPFGGSGVRFALLSFALQFGFFAVTQIGEGCPLCGGDVFVGLLAAALAAIVGALAISFGKVRFFVLALGLVWFVPSVQNCARPRVDSVPPARVPRRRGALVSFRPNRAPPALVLA